MNLKNRLIVVVGQGYVGLPLAVEFGKRRRVVGFDIEENRIAELKDGDDHTLEVSREDFLEAKSLRFTSDASSLRETDDPMIFIVTVPTPVDKVNLPDLSLLVKASETVGRVLKPDDVVIYESTVFPGCTEEVCVPILERESGLRYLHGGEVEQSTECIPAPGPALPTPQELPPKVPGFYCGYSPERINPGDKTHRLPKIKKITSASTPRVAQAVDELYQEIIMAGTYLASSIKVAEAAKVIENAQRDLNIAFVNELSLIFHRMGIDTTEVLAAAATKWNFMPFKPGLVGGHCIGVDPYYLTYKAQELGYRPQVILSGRALNDNMGSYVAQNVIRLMLKNGINVPESKIGVMGITFKENCPDVRNSKVFDILRELNSWGVRLKVIDPWVDKNRMEQCLVAEGIPLDLCNEVDSLIVAVAHHDFECISPEQLRMLCGKQEKPVLADLKALYDQAQLTSAGFTVFRL